MATEDTPPAEDVEQDHPTETPEQAEGKRAQRERAQVAEARAAAAEERLAKLQRQAVARIAGARHLSVGEDVLNVELGGVELDALLDDDGVPDPELVEAAAAAMAQRRPGLAPRRRSGGSPDGGAREAPPRQRSSWSDVLGGRR
ncbi:hypothetical protein [Quadrisphaera sp. INWT6]|uniref:hypothetical protein n=1 Tax=Quadrisphaera sp. INWT6 TaxID=2596917 RepID=UPI0018921053|nr:hypothetical protein [Quadrisphaera sp. INWT6]MBF5081387.1 hypothetical protein [Quadrisphaera sp. INWT6]